MSNAFKIGILGTKKVGKTTLAKQLEQGLASRGFETSIVHEAAQDCPLPINRDTTIQSGYWILGTQIARETLAEYKSKIVICDRTVLDVMPFARFSYGTSSQDERDIAPEMRMLDRLIQDYVAARPYDQLFLLPTNESFWKSTLPDDEIGFRKSLDMEFRDYLEEVGVPYHVITAESTPLRLAEVLDIIMLPISSKCRP